MAQSHARSRRTSRATNSLQAGVFRPSGFIHVGKRGQVVIPAAMRQHLGFCNGDTLRAHVDEHRRLLLEKVPTDPLERLQEAFGGAYDGVDATAFVRALRDE